MSTFTREDILTFLSLQYLGKTNKPRQVIHIAGSPGSGKSYLLDKLKESTKNSSVLFKDTDDITVPILESKEWKSLTSEEERGEYYSKKVSENWSQFLLDHPNKHIVFAGLTMYWAWSPDTGGFDNGQTYYPQLILQETDTFSGLFIEISDALLIQRRYERDVKEAVLKKEKQLLKGDISIDFSAKQIQNYARVEKQHYYHTLHYRFLSQDAIFDKVIKLIS